MWSYQAVEHLGVGQSTTVRFVLTAADLATSNSRGDRVVTPAHEYELVFSDGAHEVRTSVKVWGESPIVVEKSAFTD